MNERAFIVINGVFKCPKGALEDAKCLQIPKMEVNFLSPRRGALPHTANGYMSPVRLHLFGSFYNFNPPLFAVRSLNFDHAHFGLWILTFISIILLINCTKSPSTFDSCALWSPTLCSYMLLDFLSSFCFVFFQSRI